MNALQWIAHGIETIMDNFVIATLTLIPLYMIGRALYKAIIKDIKKSTNEEKDKP